MKTACSHFCRGRAAAALAAFLIFAHGAYAADRGRPDREHRHDSPRSTGQRHSSRDRHDTLRDIGSSIGRLLGSQERTTVIRRWVPGYYLSRTERVLVEEGHYEIRHYGAITETRRDQKGERYTVVVQPERTETVWVAPRYETREVKVWVPGHWVEEVVRRPQPRPGFRVVLKF